MRTRFFMLVGIITFGLAACAPSKEDESNIANFKIVHVCQDDTRIYRNNEDQALMIWEGKLWVPLAPDATIAGVCGEEIASNSAIVMQDTNQYSTTP